MFSFLLTYLFPYLLTAHYYNRHCVRSDNYYNRDVHCLSFSALTLLDGSSFISPAKISTPK